MYRLIYIFLFCLVGCGTSYDSINKSPPCDKSTCTPPKNIQKIYKAVDLTPKVRNFAVNLAKQFPGSYEQAGYEQICRIFQHLRLNWKYVSDPKGNEYIASASESIENGLVGDCDDYAVVLAALIQSIGGTCRIVFANGDIKGKGHVYTEVCLGKTTNNWLALFANKYHAPMYYRIDTLGNAWLNLDWTRVYPGGPFYQGKIAWIVYPNEDYKWIAIKKISTEGDWVEFQKSRLNWEISLLSITGWFHFPESNFVIFPY